MAWSGVGWVVVCLLFQVFESKVYHLLTIVMIIPKFTSIEIIYFIIAIYYKHNRTRTRAQVVARSIYIYHPFSEFMILINPL